MNVEPETSPEADPIARAAAQWVLRCDRGLTAAEQDALSQWLAANPRHREAFAAHRWGWEEFDRLAGIQAAVRTTPNPDLFAPEEPRRARRLRRRLAWAALPLAAALAVGLFALRPAPEAPGTPAGFPVARTDLAEPCERHTLDDGSTIDCNRGARIAVEYSAAVRRVRLIRGEANFTVAKDAARPFVVSAGDVELRALGTVFNVRLETAHVDVVVSEGRVQVNAPQLPATAPAPLLTASQRAIIARTPDAAPRVSTLSAREVEAQLAWQPRLLDFEDTPLEQVIAEFNRRNPLQLAIEGAALRGLRLSGTFRSDNVEGFLRLMASDFGIQTEWRGEREVLLRRRK